MSAFFHSRLARQWALLLSVPLLLVNGLNPSVAAFAKGDFVSKTYVSVEMADLRKDATKRLSQFDLSFNSTGGAFYFQDAFSDLDSQHPFDHAAVIFLSKSEVGTAAGMPLRLAFFYGLNGLPEVLLAATKPVANSRDLELVRYTANEVISTLKDPTDKNGAQNLIGMIKKADPKAQIDHLEEIGILTVTTQSLQGLLGAYKILKAHPLVNETDFSSQVYKIPFYFSTASFLGDGLSKQFIIPDSFRRVTRDLRNSGVVFQSKSSFPEPFGKGWINWDEALN